MRRAALTLSSLLALTLSTATGCQGPRTEAVAIVTASGLRVPDDIDALRVQVYDAEQPTPALWDTIYTLCTDTIKTGCVTLPFSMTLIPGTKVANDSTRVVMSAQRAHVDRIDDASIFTFAPGESLRLDFVLYANCLDDVSCAALNQVCGPDARCVNLVPMPFHGEPDLSAAMPGKDLGAEADMSAGVTDMQAGGSDDLRRAIVDMRKPNDLRMIAPPPDLRMIVPPPDLLMTVPPPDLLSPPDMTMGQCMCLPGSCGSAGCNGQCVCNAVQFCNGTSCIDCGGDGQPCCQSDMSADFCFVNEFCNAGTCQGIIDMAM